VGVAPHSEDAVLSGTSIAKLREGSGRPSGFSRLKHLISERDAIDPGGPTRGKIKTGNKRGKVGAIGSVSGWKIEIEARRDGP